MACYRDSFTFLYVEYVRTSQEAQASTASYGDSFTFWYADDVSTYFTLCMYESLKYVWDVACSST
jgi:hypothetical protein